MKKIRPLKTVKYSKSQDLVNEGQEKQKNAIAELTKKHLAGKKGGVYKGRYN